MVSVTGGPVPYLSTIINGSGKTRMASHPPVPTFPRETMISNPQQPADRMITFSQSNHSSVYLYVPAHAIMCSPLSYSRRAYGYPNVRLSTGATEEAWFSAECEGTGTKGSEGVSGIATDFLLMGYRPVSISGGTAGSTRAGPLTGVFRLLDECRSGT